MDVSREAAQGLGLRGKERVAEAVGVVAAEHLQFARDLPVDGKIGNLLLNFLFYMFYL